MKAAVSAYTAPTATPSKAARPVGGTVRRARTTQATIAVTDGDAGDDRRASVGWLRATAARGRTGEEEETGQAGDQRAGPEQLPGADPRAATHVPQDEREDQPADEQRLHQRQGAVVQGHDLKADADHVEAEAGEPQRAAQTCEPSVTSGQPRRPVRRRLLERGGHRRGEGRGEGQPDDEPVHRSPPSDPATARRRLGSSSQKAYVDKPASSLMVHGEDDGAERLSAVAAPDP